MPHWDFRPGLSRAVKSKVFIVKDQFSKGKGESVETWEEQRRCHVHLLQLVRKSFTSFSVKTKYQFDQVLF